MKGCHLCGLLSINRRNGNDFTFEQATIEELGGENEPPLLNSDGEVRELDGESMRNTECVIAGEGLRFGDVVISVADIHRVFTRNITHNVSPAYSARSSRQ